MEGDLTHCQARFLLLKMVPVNKASREGAVRKLKCLLLLFEGEEQVNQGKEDPHQRKKASLKTLFVTEGSKPQATTADKDPLDHSRLKVVAGR